LRWEPKIGLMAALSVAGTFVLWFSGCPSPQRPDQARSADGRRIDDSARVLVGATPADAALRTTIGLSPGHSDGDSGITAPCILHAGDSHSHRREVLGPGGKVGQTTSKADCSFNAECVREQGKSSPGDGDVSVDCVDRRCTCTRRPLSRSVPPTVFTFELETPCSSTDVAQQVLQERCMKGMRVDRR
jgi:hypothetical protein